MKRNMEPNAAGKNGKLTLDRGGWHGQRQLNADEWVRRAYRNWAARGKVDGQGRYVSRAMADTAQEIRFPANMPARILSEALDGGATVAWAREYPAIWDEYIVRKARERGMLVDERVAA